MKRTTTPTKRPRYKPAGSPGQRLRREQAERQRQAERTMRGQLAQALVAGVLP